MVFVVYYSWYFLFNFFAYGIIGWGIEQIYCYLLTGQMKKEGFLYGPFKPMYAIAMSLLILINDTFLLTPFALLALCLLIPTTVEYLSGFLTRHLFHQDYWDYSMLKFNLHGLICPQFSICWMILTFIGVQYFQPLLVAPFIHQNFSAWFVICPFICAAFLIDEGCTLRRFIRKHAIIGEMSDKESEADGSRQSYL